MAFKGGDVTGLAPFRLSRRGIRFDALRRVDKMTDVSRETEQVLDSIGLLAERNVPAGSLAYGKHRALEVAMALSTDPDLVMLDEPTAGMSKEETRTTVELIKKLTRGKTMVIVEHDMDVFFSLADRITVLYYGLIHALQNVSLSVARGEIVCLLGRNGMDKSATLKSIMGLVKPQSGSIVFKGGSVFQLPSYKVTLAGIGLVPQERRIFPNLTVEENLLMGVKAGRKAPDGLEPWTLERVYGHFNSLERRRSNKGAQLSGGEQQMLSMGRALMGNPTLLLVDEPGEGLAPLLVKEVRDVLQQINQAGVSILLVEHNIKVAMSLAQRCYLLGKGYVAFSGTMRELADRPDVMAKYLEVS